ncbi:fibronectin type III domain-containing protein 9 isoform X1 [Anguilla rostrata]|uniref:fibronectin type III domain-containing protein 9 isoform X1 n=2 Tax=Anguilla rostrata TaxID=7938 RepID=UPI0030D1CF58
MAPISSAAYILCGFNVLQTLSFQKSPSHWRAPRDKDPARKKQEDGMSLAVQDITATSATVAWSAVPGGCRGGFYSVMYHPNWNSLLTGHAHRNFLREVAVPAGQTSAGLGDLSPRTTYVLCVTCQAATPASPAHLSRDRCRVFNTLEEEAAPGSRAWDGASGELAMGVWLASTILLAVIAGVLLYGCLRAWCHWEQDWNGKGAARRPSSASSTGSPSRSAVTPPPRTCAPEQATLSAQPDPQEPRATP